MICLGSLLSAEHDKILTRITVVYRNVALHTEITLYWVLNCIHQSLQQRRTVSLWQNRFLGFFGGKEIRW